MRNGMTRPLSSRRGKGLPMALAGALVLALLAALSCGGGGGSDAANDLLKMLPDDSDGMVYVDTAEIFNDNDLRDVQDSVEYNWSNIADLEDDFDLDIDDLTYVAYGEADDGDLILLGGVEDLDDLRDELDDLDYDDDEIEDEEVWVNGGEYWEAVAFLGGGAVLIAEYEDDMEDALERWKEGDDSYHDEVEEVASKLPSGVAWSIRYCGSDCFQGIAIEKESDDEVKIHSVTLYDDEDDAEDAFDDIEDDIEDDDLPRGCDDAKADLDNDIVQVEIVCDTDDTGNFYEVLNFNF